MRYESLSLLQPAPGTSRSLSVYRVGGSDPGPVVYLQAGLHADEWPGLLILQHLLQRLQHIESAGGIRGEIIIVPYANPIGMAQNLFGYVTGRFDMTGTGNFNRNFIDPFPAVRNRVGGMLGCDEQTNRRLIQQALHSVVTDWRVEDESTALKKVLLSLSLGADVVLDLHCDDRTAGHLYAVKSQADQALALAARLGFKYVFLEDLDGVVAFDGTHLQVWHRLQQTFPDHPIGLPVFAATLEYRGQTGVEDDLAIEDADNLLAYLRQLGCLADAEARPLPLTVRDVVLSPLEAVDTVKAPVCGLLVFRRPLGAHLRAGEVFAEIVLVDAPVPNRRVPIASSTEGHLMGLSHRRLVRPGDQIAKIAGKEALAHRQPGKLLQL